MEQRVAGCMMDGKEYSADPPRERARINRSSPACINPSFSSGIVCRSTRRPAQPTHKRTDRHERAEYSVEISFSLTGLARFRRSLSVSFCRKKEKIAFTFVKLGAVFLFYFFSTILEQEKSAPLLNKAVAVE